MKTKLIAVVGPTASGKTSLAVSIAEAFNGSVVSADSMQIYKHMEIATAKPTAEEMHGIKHYLIDFLDMDESYSVGQYVIDAKKAVNEIVSEGKTPVLCGGTGLYVDSLINGIDFTDDSKDEKVRAELKALLDEKGLDCLIEILRELDPQSVERLSVERNPKRIMRAIEFYRTTGTTITQQNETSRLRGSEFNALIFGLTASDRQYIYDRINLRVDIMLQSGLLEEAKAVLSSDLSDTAKGAIGYRQLKPYFDGEKSLDECIERLKIETRHYAKRQLTWFKRNENIRWINIDELRTTEEQLNSIENIIRGFING